MLNRLAVLLLLLMTGTGCIAAASPAETEAAVQPLFAGAKALPRVSADVYGPGLSSGTPEIITSGKKAWSDEHEEGHEASLAVDADASNNSYWSAWVDRDAPVRAEDGQFLYVDLAGLYQVDAVSIRNYADGERFYHYDIQASLDGLYWNTIASKRDSRIAADNGDVYGTDIQARYLRVHMTYNSANYGVHISDFKAYGSPVHRLKEDIRWTIEDAGSRIRDTAGGADGTWMDGDFADGFTGQALRFDGDRSRMIIDRDDIEGPWTVTAWVYRQDSANISAIMMDSPAASLRLEQDNGGDKVGFTRYGTADYTFNYKVPLQKWTHLAWVNDGNSMKLYANGLLADTKQQVTIPLPMRTLGAEYRSMKGMLDDVRIYKRALTESELAATVSADALEVEASPDKGLYGPGEQVNMSLRLHNKSDIAVHLAKITSQLYDTTKPTADAETELLPATSLAPGQSVRVTGVPLLRLPLTVNAEVYGVRLYAYDSYGAATGFNGGFFRVRPVPAGTLTSYAIDRFDSGGVDVYALDGGLSAEYAVQKSLENLNAGTSHSWYVSGPGQGPNPVYATPGFLKQSIERTTAYYDQWLGADTTFDTVIISTGVASVPYLSRAMKAPVLPLHYLASVNSVNEVQTILNRAEKDGLSAYATLGYDGSFPDSGVAWIKLLSMPQAYTDFLNKHRVRNVVMVGSEGVLGETTAKRILTGRGAAGGEGRSGDMYVVYTNKGSAADLQQLRAKLTDLDHYVLESRYGKVSDWESGIVKRQTDRFVKDIKSGTAVAGVVGIFDQVINLYELASRVMLDFYKKNGLQVQGIVLNPYLISHPFYESKLQYVPYLFWQGNEPEWIVNDLIAINLKRTIQSQFPQTAVEQLPVWIDVANNFGGYRAEQLRDALAAKGFANVALHDYSADEEWRNDGRTAPVERIAREMALYPPGGLKQWDAGLVPLTATDVMKYGKRLDAPTANEQIGLVAAWRFDESASGTDGDAAMARDDSGNGLEAAIHGAIRTADGKSGKALRFDGNDDAVYIGKPDLAPSWTLSLWVNREDNPNSSSVLMNSRDYSIRLEQGSFTNKVGITRYGAGDYTFNYEAPVGEWTHLAFVGTADGTTLYVNGQYRDFIGVAIGLPMGTIGHSFNSMKGSLDEVKLFNKALPPEAIRSLAQGLFMKLEFESASASGNAITDSSGFMHKGTMSGIQLTSAGKHGKGAKFNGLNSHIRFDRHDLGTPWTAAMWVKREDSPHRSAKLMVSPVASLALEQESHTNRVGFTQFGALEHTFAYEAPVGVWTHLTFVAEDNGISLYVNGVLRETAASGIALPMQYVGNTFYPVKGTIDDVRLFDRALSAGEIGALAAP